VLLGALGLAVYLLSTDWLLTAAVLAIAVVLVVAVVSNTHADVALVLAVASLVAAAPLEEPEPDALTPVAGADTVVALGDSYMSGEGASVYYAGTNDAAGDHQCRRSPTAYAARLVVEKHRFDRLVFLGCSGARTYNVVATADDPGHARAQTGETGTQVDQLQKLRESNPGFRPSLVLVGIGGNDAGFATIGEICLAPGDCSSQRTLFEHNLPSVRRALFATYSSIRKAVPGVPVLAIPYPQPIADTRRCNGVALTQPERDFIRSFVDQLDRTVETAASQAGIYYAAEMKGSLAAKRIQLCATSKSNAGINFVDLRSVSGLTAQRFNPARWLHNSLHPNDRGHAAMLETLETWISSHPDVTAGGRTPAPVPAGAVTEPDPPCSMTVTDNPSCQQLAREWEMRELRSRAWWSVGSVLLGLLLVWAVSVIILGRVRAMRGTGSSSVTRSRGTGARVEGAGR
jgi:lysophospholipase L1-like esterase